MHQSEITLTWAEVLVAANVGVMRNVQSKRLGREPNHDNDLWISNIEGAMGEMAVAKLLGLYWAGAIGDIDADDVGPYQVKTNSSRKWDDLIIQERNKPDRVYISALCFDRKFVVTGWAVGAEVKQKCYWRAGKPNQFAYFVPRKLLRPMSELPSISDAYAMQEAA